MKALRLSFYRHQEQGFSLVETAVVVAVLGTLAAVGTAAYNGTLMRLVSLAQVAVAKVSISNASKEVMYQLAWGQLNTEKVKPFPVLGYSIQIEPIKGERNSARVFAEPLEERLPYLEVEIINKKGEKYCEDSELNEDESFCTGWTGRL